MTTKKLIKEEDMLIDNEIVEHSLFFLGDVIKKRTKDRNPAYNVGARCENNVFIMRSYCWGCDLCWQQENSECQINFLHKESGVALRWYKYVGRGMEWITEPRDAIVWNTLIIECLVSLYRVHKAADFSAMGYCARCRGYYYGEKCPQCKDD